MSKAKTDCRAVAAKCLAAVSNGSSLSQQIPLFEHTLAESDRPLFRQLCYGVLRFFPKLVGIEKQLLSKPLKSKDRDIQMLLLLGLYQLSEMRTPDHAAVNTTVNATKALKKGWAKGLVNGVLRKWQRDSESLVAALSDAEQQSHPQWLHDALLKAWPNHATAIEQANNLQAPMCLRVNTQHCDVVTYLNMLEAENIVASACEHTKHGVRLRDAVAVSKLPKFEQGWVSVQDEAPQLSAALLSLAPGHRVLDACCAPGGKSCHILESEPALSELVALDIDEQRLQRVTENLDRIGLQATLVSGDAADPAKWWDGQQFDRILLDAPCSATGVIRRNPDIKIHRRANDITQLSKLQGEILTALWQTLKPGGLLLYATCSVLPEENTQVVEAFIKATNDAEHKVIDANWGISQAYGRQLLPQTQGHDGFYYALISKKP